ncbi:MAG: hypothetical protein QOJ26_973 [Thermoplasmata archaeon]|jgi:hypothetical protein|nr:hypothetical protein [Thermoplasmata archaeon]MEA3166104.1 hypothetical protein [Thermoplasmata archaeon]
MAMKPFKEWKPWQKYTTFAVAGILVLYGVFLAVALPSNGTKVHAYLEAGTLSDGSMYFRCDTAQSTPGACDPAGTDGNPDQAKLTVHKRDRLTITVHSADGGGRAHDFKMDGMGYFLPPERMEMEMHKDTQSKTITAWMSGTFHIKCEIPGHEGKGMWATLVVS